MITWVYSNDDIQESGFNPVSGNPATAYCLEEDIAKLPTEGVPNGTTVYTMDSHKIFMFDAENKRWLEQ